MQNRPSLSVRIAPLSLSLSLYLSRKIFDLQTFTRNARASRTGYMMSRAAPSSQGHWSVVARDTDTRVPKETKKKKKKREKKYENV